MLKDLLILGGLMLMLAGCVHADDDDADVMVTPPAEMEVDAEVDADATY